MIDEVISNKRININIIYIKLHIDADVALLVWIPTRMRRRGEMRT